MLLAMWIPLSLVRLWAMLDSALLNNLAMDARRLKNGQSRRAQEVWKLDLEDRDLD